MRGHFTGTFTCDGIENRTFQENTFLFCVIGMEIQMQAGGGYEPNCSEPVLRRLEGIWNFSTFTH